MQSGAIPNALITASSVWPDAGSEPWRARLHNQPKLPYNTYVDVAAWVAKSNAVGEYLQVDLGRAMYVTAVATQGRPYLTSENQRVKKYRLTYKLSGNPWMRYKEYNAFKEFVGNSDITTVVTHRLKEKLQAQYIRFVVRQWNFHISES
ncbi:hypothetical protein QZH41_004967 [Actinostola sp. cb2023]|nr:hypothetical protein QZH41_004967 [Actinostola sp. cb2023]